MSLWLPPSADPPSLPATPRRAPIFDAADHRNRGKPSLDPASLPPGWLNRMIAMTVRFGMPRRIAEEARTNPYVCHDVALLASLISETAAGNRKAKAVLDRLRTSFGNQDAISEILEAQEQPADPAELQQLMGLDQ